MKLVTIKEVASDVGFVSSEALLKEFLNGITECNEESIKEVLLKNRTYNINNPNNISALPDIEFHIDTPGVLYYDYINNRLRIRGLDNWKTINI